MPEGATSVSLKCKICGGDIRNDYFAGTCVCAHCGNKWDMKDMIPDYEKHARSIELVAKAKEMLSGKPDVASAGQAKLVFKTAALECTQHPDAISSEILKVCDEGIAEANCCATYAKGKSFFEKKHFRQARQEFMKIKGTRDTEELIEVCDKELIIARRKQIPLAILVGTILPAVIAIVLHEKLNFPISVCIPIFVVLTAGAAYGVYLEGTLATAIIGLSFVCAVPLIIFMVLAYGFNVDTGPAAALAVGIPIAVIIGVAALPERS